MLRKGRRYSPEEILPRVKFPSSVRFHSPREDLDGDQINFGTLRLQTFVAKGITCVACRLRGSFFVKEKHRTGERYYHLSLYALGGNGKEVLMTKDHRISKDKGGKDTLDNLDPMCFPCNQAKGNRGMISRI